MDVRFSGLQTLSVAAVLSSEQGCPAWSEHSGMASTLQQRGEEDQGAPAFCRKACFEGKAFVGSGVFSRALANPQVPHRI